MQGIKETPQNFLIRTFDLRQKILFASQEDESGLKYDPGLVQNMFLHTALTGLQNDNIKRDLQPYLEQTDFSDELLLERMNTACAYETERQNKKKLLGQPWPATITAPIYPPASAPVKPVTKAVTAPVQLPTDTEPAAGILVPSWSRTERRNRSISTEVHSTTQLPPPNRGRMKKCYGCQQRGTEEYCTHC